MSVFKQSMDFSDINGMFKSTQSLRILKQNLLVGVEILMDFVLAIKNSEILRNTYEVF